MLGPLIVDVASTQLDNSDRDLLQSQWIGGVILFSRNIGNRDQLVELIGSLRDVRPELLISVDQEGGRVQRCREGFTRIPPMAIFGKLFALDREKALEMAETCGWLLASEMLATGFDLSYAPVLDVDENYSSVIGDRSFSLNPEEVSILSGAFIDGAKRAGMKVTGKHFPGHGGIGEDSHLTLPVDHRAMSAIQSRDLKPFTRNLSILDAVMPAHILFPEVDKNPVGFSSVWLQNILKQQLGFSGMVVSDDLSMEGAGFAGGHGDRVIAALEAGCDAVLVCNHREGVLDAVGALDRLYGDLPSLHERLPGLPRRELAAMRPSHRVNWHELESDPLWLLAQQQIEALNNGIG